MNGDGSLRSQLPPISTPYSRILKANHSGNQQMGQQNLRTSTNLESPLQLARSLSQPLQFGLDSLYQAENEQPWGESSYSLLQPSPFAPSGNCFGIGAGFQAHRRAISDGILQLPGTIPQKSPVALDIPVQWVNRDPIYARNGDNNNNIEMMQGDMDDEDVFSAYIDFDCEVASNQPAGALESEDKMNGADGRETNETISGDESWRNAFKIPAAGGVPFPWPDQMMSSDEVKRAAGADVSQMNQHLRSVSEGGSMENTGGFVEIPQYPAGSTLPPSQLLPPVYASGSNSNALSLMLSGVGFRGADVNKIMGNPKLSDIALRDPRRAKRILSNRKSAERSKERKMRYVAELEHRVMTLQNEVTMVSGQVARLERDSSILTTHNNELKLRVHGCEQQAHLQEALKEALTDELQRLRLASGTCYRIHQGDQVNIQETNIHMQPPQKQQTVSQQPNNNDQVITYAEHEPDNK